MHDQSNRVEFGGAALNEVNRTLLQRPAHASRSPEPRDGKTVAALVTPVSRGAIATITVDGPNALDRVAQLCQTSSALLARKTENGRLWIGQWRNGEPIVVYVRRADQLEIHCHGGTMSSQAILGDLAQLSIATDSAWDIAGRDCQSQIELEALHALGQATTLRSAGILLDQYHGALSSLLTDLVQRLDEGKTSEVASSLARLIERFEVGGHLIDPWRIAIVGRPNVGKSSLLNAIVGFDRAIVHSTAGTTRDLVTAVTAVGGWPVELCDSAGIRAAMDEVELAGVEIAQRAIAESDRQLVVLDASQTLTEVDQAILRSCPQPLVIANKSDLASCWNFGELAVPVIATSAHTGSGIAQLLGELEKSLVPDPPAPGEAIPFTARQVDLLRDAYRMLGEAEHITHARELLLLCVTKTI